MIVMILLYIIYIIIIIIIIIVRNLYLLTLPSRRGLW